MFRFTSLVAFVIIALPLARSLPTAHGAADGSASSPGSGLGKMLLGRRYSFQPRAPGGPFYLVQDTDTAPAHASADAPPANLHQKRHASPFPKYIAEHRLHTRDVAHEHTDLSHVDATPANPSYAEPYPPAPPQPSPLGASLTTKTTTAAHVTASAAKNSHDKSKHSKTKKMREMESLD